ncbi:MAG: hypothetical protein LBQ95_04225 [Lachnospiraceae bacterium]|jgi:hypothetical protein|nr:hypothetical protein [Lachnospiraceae bacterium]
MSGINNNSRTNTKANRKTLIKTVIVYLGISALCVIITNVYALFGHGIRSGFMDYMFLYPLAGIIIFVVLLLVFGNVSRFASNLFHAGVATLTVGSLLSGIFVIAGSASSYTKYFYIIGSALCTLGIIAAIAQRGKKGDVPRLY